MPLAQVDRVLELPGWQVWSVERRENLLEDQSVLNLAKRGKASSAAGLFDYYLGYLTDPSVTRHFQLDPRRDRAVRQALGHERRGRRPAPRDRGGARKLGGKVVLGGHSLGGSVVTAYATWNFNGHAGADELGWADLHRRRQRPGRVGRRRGRRA